MSGCVSVVLRAHVAFWRRLLSASQPSQAQVHRTLHLPTSADSASSLALPALAIVTFFTVVSSIRGLTNAHANEKTRGVLRTTSLCIVSG